MAKAELDELIVADAEALRAWFVGSPHHVSRVGLALTKKGGTVTTLTWQQAVDEALCFGWIDGQARKRDAETSWIRVHPAHAPQFLVTTQRRQADSPWTTHGRTRHAS